MPHKTAGMFPDEQALRTIGQGKAAKVIPFWEKTTTQIAADLGKKNTKCENGSNCREMP